jgi:hyperosmotically inducible protein
MKLIPTLCVSVLALFGACEKKAHGADNTAPHNTPATTDAEVGNRVRQAIQNDAALSPLLPNVQITSVNGTVTLKGTVKTQKDKEALGAKAQGTTGVMNVDNQLTVSG